MGAKLPDGTPLELGVYKAYRNAGLSHSQALAITAEVGRENGFQPNILFGGHIDPAASTGGGAIANTGMLSWNGNRGSALINFLKGQGVWKGGSMAQNQAALNAQARFSVAEMKSPKYADKLQTFWKNPNANPEAFSRELGKNYVVWAYGQDTIRAQGGGRTAFNWKAHDQRRRGYLQNIANMTGGGNFQAQEEDPRLAMSAPDLLKTLRKTGKMNDNQLFINLANGNGKAAQEINYLLDSGHSPDDIARQLGLKIKLAPQPQSQQPMQAQAQDTGLGLSPEDMQILGIDDGQQSAQAMPQEMPAAISESVPLESSFNTHSVEPEPMQAPEQQQSGKLQAITAELPKLKEQGLSPYQALYSLAQREDDIGHSIRGAFSEGMDTEQMANYFGVNDIWQSQKEPSRNTLQTDAPRGYQTPLLSQS